MNDNVAESSTSAHYEYSSVKYFSHTARNILQKYFQENQYPQRAQKEAIAREVSAVDGTQYPAARVAAWFASRRQAEKKKSQTAALAQWKEFETILMRTPCAAWNDQWLNGLLNHYGIGYEEGMALANRIRRDSSGSNRADVATRPAPLQISTDSFGAHRRTASQLPTPASSQSPELKPIVAHTAVSPMQTPTRPSPSHSRGAFTPDKEPLRRNTASPVTKQEHKSSEHVKLTVRSPINVQPSSARSVRVNTDSILGTISSTRPNPFWQHVQFLEATNFIPGSVPSNVSEFSAAFDPHMVSMERLLAHAPQSGGGGPHNPSPR